MVSDFRTIFVRRAALLVNICIGEYDSHVLAAKCAAVRKTYKENKFMLLNIKNLYGDKLDALDGDIGHVKDFYFDDESWVIRYLVV